MNSTEQMKMNFLSKLLIAKMYNIEIDECMKCSKGNDGIPGCMPGECDLPIELKNDKYGKIKVLPSKLNNGKWQFSFDVHGDYDTYILLAFSKKWENIERVYIIPREDMERNMEENIEIMK